ncbi:mCG145434, partial [Mus musculus]
FWLSHSSAAEFIFYFMFMDQQFCLFSHCASPGLEPFSSEDLRSAHTEMPLQLLCSDELYTSGCLMSIQRKPAHSTNVSMANAAHNNRSGGVRDMCACLPGPWP